MLYTLLKLFVGVCFNLLNLLLAGNLPPLASVCVVIERDGLLLVVRQPKGESVFPGGFVRWRETVEQAAMRECLEETGLRVRIEELVAYDSAVSRRFTRISTLTIVFTAEVLDGELRGSIEGEPCWMAEEELRASLHDYQGSVYAYYVDYRARQARPKIVPNA